MSTTSERVKKVTADVLKIDPSAISDTSRFIEDLGGDSVKAAEWVAMTEIEFDIEFDPNRAMQFRTIKDIVQAIEA